MYSRGGEKLIYRGSRFVPKGTLRVSPMSTTTVVESPAVNKLLAALPGHEYDRLRPHLEPVSLSLKQVLFEPGENISHVYFPTGSVVCTVLVLDDASMETGIVGSEGMVGLPVFLGSHIAFSRAL